MAARQTAAASDWKDGFVTHVVTLSETAGNACYGVQVTYAWPAVETLPEGIYLGEEDGRGLSGSFAVTSLGTTGRKQRREDFRVPVTIQTYMTGVTASATSAKESEQRALAMWFAIESMLAGDSTFSELVHGYTSDYECRTVPHKSGYASRVTGFLDLYRELS